MCSSPPGPPGWDQSIAGLTFTTARCEPLRTDGHYSVVRHPLMLCDVFWPLGLSLIFGSIIGVPLTPLWLLVVWVLTQVEEESLVREYGEADRDFRSRVPRLFPRPARHRPQAICMTNTRHQSTRRGRVRGTRSSTPRAPALTPRRHMPGSAGLPRPAVGHQEFGRDSPAAVPAAGQAVPGLSALLRRELGPCHAVGRLREPAFMSHFFPAHATRHSEPPGPPAARRGRRLLARAEECRPCLLLPGQAFSCRGHVCGTRPGPPDGPAAVRSPLPGVPAGARGGGRGHPRPVRAENPVHGSDQQVCSPGARPVMITDHVPAVRVPPDHAASSVAAAIPAGGDMEDRRDLDWLCA